LKNYRKNKTFYGSIKFVVTSENSKQGLQQILRGRDLADPAKVRISLPSNTTRW
jgi:hypothetical protein